MENPKVYNPNDFKVVEFHNSTDFTFTPEMGCMYDGRPISGITGAPGVNAGESLTVPYHIGHQLALNLAKVAINKTAPAVDPAGIPTGVPLWDDVRLNNLKGSYLKELYTEEKPLAVSETDRLMAKVEEYKKMVDQFISNGTESGPRILEGVLVESEKVTGYQDKADVIAELEKRGIVHDKRKNKAELEKLLA